MKITNNDIKKLKKNYQEFIKLYSNNKELPSIWAFNQHLAIDNTYISNLITNKSKDTKNKHIYIEYINTLNDMYNNIKELLIHKLINSTSNNNSSNILKMLNEQYNTYLGEYNKNNANKREIVVNICSSQCSRVKKGIINV